MAKNDDYGTKRATPQMRAYFCSVQKPDEYASKGDNGKAGKDTWAIQLHVDLSDPKQVAFVQELTDFENQRRAANGQPKVEQTTAVKTKRDKRAEEDVTILRAKTFNKPDVYDEQGKPTGLDVWKDDEVVAVITPKFNPNAFGSPVLALYFDGVRIMQKNSGGGGQSSAALLGVDLTEVTVEEPEEVEAEQAIDLSSVDLKV